MNSNNGTFVRGERIDTYNLNDGDEFALGKHSIRYQNLNANRLNPPVQPVKPTGNQGGGGMTMLVDSVEMEQLQRERASKLAAYLLFTSEAGVRQTLPLLKTATFFGSHTTCDLCLKGWGVQYKHAIILRDETGFRLVNLVPKKGVLLNGEEIDDARLNHGDRFRISKFDYQFYVGSPTSL
jgi:pSer/pThr/pTyr-binding forkhead associated (FHA) protein